MKKPPQEAPSGTAAAAVDSQFLKALVGYNARRATLKILALFEQRMAEHGLKPVEFSVLSLIGRNPNLTPGQLCAELDLLPSNLAKILARLGKRELIDRDTQHTDRRAVLLNLSRTGHQLITTIEPLVMQLESDAVSALTLKQRETLISLLQRIYC